MTDCYRGTMITKTHSEPSGFICTFNTVLLNNVLHYKSVLRQPSMTFFSGDARYESNWMIYHSWIQQILVTHGHTHFYRNRQFFRRHILTESVFVTQIVLATQESGFYELGGLWPTCCLMSSMYGKVHSITWNRHSIHKTSSRSVWYYKDIILYKNSCLSLTISSPNLLNYGVSCALNNMFIVCGVHLWAKMKHFQYIL